MSRIIVTGGCGFFGHHLIEHLIKNTDWEIIILDKLSYATDGFDKLRDINVFDNKRIRIFAIDLTLPISEGVIKEIGLGVDYIYHVAANSHVDNSITNPVPFVIENVKITLNVLELARIVKPKLFINFSTDEVFGPAPEGVFFNELDSHNPSNPYAASKSAQESIGIAYSNTYKVPVITTHTMNLLGERQNFEKFVPLIMRSILLGETMNIHANKDKTKAGSRCYIHCRNVASALLHITKLGYNGYDEWNIAGEQEIDNLDLAQRIAKIMGKELKYEMVDFHSSRPGHDLRYALDSSKLLTSGFSYPKTFDDSLKNLVEWTMDNKKWLGL